MDGATPENTRQSADGAALPHDSASRHVAGAARYADDVAEPKEMVHVALGLAAIARGQIITADLGPVRRADGVLAVLTADDVPGHNDTGPVVHDEPAFALSADGDSSAGTIHFRGQPLFAVVAESRDAARRAVGLAQIEYDEAPPVLTIDDAIAAGSYLHKPYRMARGTVEPALQKAAHRLQGQIDMGGQDHFYLEGQIAIATPGETDEMHILSSLSLIHISEPTRPY